MSPTESPVFVGGEHPYWRLACGCEVGALRLVRCPLHAAAEEMRALLRAIVVDGALATDSQEYEADARALLARIEAP